MLRRDFRLGALLATLLALAGAAPAGAAETDRLYHGETARGGTVGLIADRAGRVYDASVEWSVNCPRTGYRARGTVTFSPLRHATSRREFAVAGGAMQVEEWNGVEAVNASTEMTISGRRRTPRGRPGSESYAGVFDLRIVMRETVEPASRVIERCGMRRVRWRAWREGFGTGRLDMTSTPSDPLADGQTVAIGPGKTIVARGDRRSVTFVVFDRDRRIWEVRVDAPDGLVAGRRYADPGGYDFATPTSQLYVTRDEVEGCGPEPTGEFTITHARYDRRGRMRDMTVTFEHRCAPEGAALRGTISFRSRR